MTWRRDGMLAVEFAALVVFVAAALAVMAFYVKRGLSGRWRSVGDTFGYGRQYQP